MENKTLKFIIEALVIVWMIVVFLFSCEQSNETKDTSGRFTKQIVNIVSKVVNIPENAKEDLVIKLNPYIRKFAHYSLYTIGGIFIIISLKQYKNLSEKKKIIISLALGILYAISDEIHQYYVPGRSAKIQDVYIDTLGIATGVILILTIVKLYNHRKEIKLGGVTTNEYVRRGCKSNQFKTY